MNRIREFSDKFGTDSIFSKGDIAEGIDIIEEVNNCLAKLNTEKPLIHKGATTGLRDYHDFFDIVIYYMIYKSTLTGREMANVYNIFLGMTAQFFNLLMKKKIILPHYQKMLLTLRNEDSEFMKYILQEYNYELCMRTIQKYDIFARRNQNRKLP